MATGYFKLYRPLQDHWIYKDSRYIHLWLECLINARWSEEPKTDVYKGTMYRLSRGQFLFSRPTYSERLGIDEATVRRCIDLMVKDNMIEKVMSIGRNKPTIYQVVNFDKYNSLSEPTESVVITDLEGDSDQVETKSKPSGDQVTATKEESNKSNKGNKDNLKTYSSDSDEFRLSNLLYGLMLKNNPSLKKPNIQSWCKHIDLMIRRDGRSVKDIERVIRWCQQDSFWHVNILSTSKLRQKYDQLFVKMNSTQKQGVNTSNENFFNDLVKRNMQNRKVVEIDDDELI